MEKRNRRIASNLKALRKQFNLTQEGLAERMEVKRSSIGAYEEGRAEPSLAFLQKICSLFQLDFEDFVLGDWPEKISKDNLRVLTIPVDKTSDTEMAVMVPLKAAAGYMQGHADPEYVEQLPRFSLPFPELTQRGTFRLFQIEGDSMLPVPSGAYVISTFVQDWFSITSDQPCIVLSMDDGILFKRVKYLKSKNAFILTSDNSVFQPFELSPERVREIWKVVGYTILSAEWPV